VGVAALAGAHVVGDGFPFARAQSNGKEGQRCVEVEVERHDVADKQPLGSRGGVGALEADGVPGGERELVGLELSLDVEMVDVAGEEPVCSRGKQRQAEQRDAREGKAAAHGDQR
jgi:hypothetical protein